MGPWAPGFVHSQKDCPAHSPSKTNLVFTVLPIVPLSLAFLSFPEVKHEKTGFSAVTWGVLSSQYPFEADYKAY